MINSFDLGEVSQCHPGEVLLRDVIGNACADGLETFDLGVGDTPYKTNWCPHVDRLFETHLALSARGLPYSFAAASFLRAKRRLKKSPRAMRLLRRVGLA